MTEPRSAGDEPPRGRRPIAAAGLARRSWGASALRLDDRDSLGIWSAGLLVGLRTMRKEPLLGLKRIALPVSYWRSREFAYVWRQIDLPAPAHVLDLGSPKDLAVMLARHRGYRVVATDILPDAIALSERYARAQGLAGDGPGRVLSAVQDGRALTYPDDYFDAVYSVSVLEHIPDRGDSFAIQELIRVVRPGGIVVVTVPFDLEYRETFLDGPVYERKQQGKEPIFFERHYDARALAQRLLRSRDVDVIDLQFWGEGRVRVEAMLSGLGPVRTLLSPIEAFLGAAALKQVDPGGADHPMAAFLTLRKR